MSKGLRLLSWLAPALMIVSLAFSSLAAAEEQSHYFVEEEMIRLVLDGFPDDHRQEFVDFRLVRTAESTGPLDFSLSDLVDGEGRLFPRQMVMIKTPYDSKLQKTGLSFNQIRFLAGGDEYAELKMAVLYNEEIRAGTYRGKLHSPQGKDIPVEIIVNRYTEIRVEPREISLQIPGPGLYQAKEPIEVTVWANHGDWVINLTCSGLFYQEDAEVEAGWLDAKPARPSLQLSVVGEERQILSEMAPVLGSEYGWGTTFNLKVQTKAGWEHRAGDYAGVIKIDVSIQE